MRNASDIVKVIIIALLLPIAIQPIHLDIFMLSSPASLLPRHSHGLSSGVRRFKELAETLFADFEGLLRCGVGHTGHGAPKVECVGYVSADTKEDEEDEVDRVSED